MKRSHLILFIGGALVAAGMVVSFYGSVLTTQDLTIAEGTVSPGSPVEVTKDLDPAVTDIGAFVVHAENFAEDSLLARLYDPAGTEIETKKITGKSTEQKFDISSKGTYKLVLENTGTEASVTIGLIHYPDDFTLSVNIAGQGIIISGFVGVGVAIIYEIKTRKSKIS